MKHQCTGSTLTLGFFQLIGPTTIISHVASTEKVLVIETRIVHHGDDNLSLHVDAFVVIPIIFRCIDTETHKHKIGIRYDNLFLSTKCPNYNVIREIQVHASLGCLYTDTVLVRTGKSRDFTHRLEITTLIGRLQTQFLELISNVVDGLCFVLRQWLAATEFVGCQCLDSFFPESNLFFVLLVLCHGRQAERCRHAQREK